MSLAQKLLQSIKSSPTPIATRDLVSEHGGGVKHARRQIWNRLAWLERNCYVAKFSKKHNCTTWVLGQKDNDRIDNFLRGRNQ